MRIKLTDRSTSDEFWIWIRIVKLQIRNYPTWIRLQDQLIGLNVIRLSAFHLSSHRSVSELGLGLNRSAFNLIERIDSIQFVMMSKL